ncbi:MAG: phenylacetate--CoA ligase family protein, partial [Raoultibacter sp.]
DIITVFFETACTGDELKRVEEELSFIFKGKIGCTPIAKGVPLGDLPRSEKKTQRIFDNRY